MYNLEDQIEVDKEGNVKIIKSADPLMSRNSDIAVDLKQV